MVLEECWGRACIQEEAAEGCLAQMSVMGDASLMQEAVDRAGREVQVRAMMALWPEDAVWCASERSAPKQVTRQQVGLEAVEQLQASWRRLKRGEKAISKAIDKVNTQLDHLHQEEFLMGSDSPWLKGPPELRAHSGRKRLCAGPAAGRIATQTIDAWQPQPTAATANSSRVNA